MGSKTALQMRADLRLDLKDSGSLWSDAELNRCIERAVSDLSRYLPEERYYELSLQFAVSDETVTFPKDTDDDLIVDGADISATLPSATLTISAQPDVPRPLVLTITDPNESMEYCTLIVRGTDRFGQALEETFRWLKGLSTITGKEYFKTVNEVEVDQMKGNGTGDVLDLGTGAYTDVWVFLANNPVKKGSESGTDGASAALARDTDYDIDYIRGALKAISGGDIAAEEACKFNYTKIQVGIDLESIPRLIRVQRCEYPVGETPQSFCPFDVHGSKLFVSGIGEYEEQPILKEDSHIRLYYDASHISPNDWASGTIPYFLENTVIMASSAYALLIYALKHEHQAGTDLTSMKTALTAAGTAHTALDTALANIKKYLDNNSDADAVGLLADITTEIASLRTAIVAALDAANTYLDAVAGDLTAADGVAAEYIGATNYVTGGTAPDCKKYLDDGDALLNKIALGGENERTPEIYALFARTVRESIVSAYEIHRAAYVDDARARTNAGIGYVQEAAQRLANLRSYIDQSERYTTVANTFAREVEARIAQVEEHIRQASTLGESASGEILLSEKFRIEAIDRRNEVLSIWGDRKQYIGDFTMGSVRQIPTGD